MTTDPIEALDCIDKTITSIRCYENVNISDDVDIYIDTVRKALVNNKEGIYKRVIKLIIEKEVDIRELRRLLFLKGPHTLVNYNHYAPPRGRLTEEEFNSIAWVINYGSN